MYVETSRKAKVVVDLSYAVCVGVDIILMLMFIIGVFYLAVGAVSLMPVKIKDGYTRSFINNSKSDSYDLNESENIKEHCFAVIIPACNEMSVIGRVIKSIQNCRYPKNKIKIICVADGCTDQTASVAAAAGATVVIRSSTGSKGDALNFGIDYLNKSGYDYDAVAFFDSDTVVDMCFFEEVNKKLLSGSLVIQGYVDSSNYDKSYVSHMHSLWYWITNRTMQTGFDKMNFGCRIEGTGYVVKRCVLEDVPPITQTVAEDREYTCILAENNIKADYAEKAKVYDEKPINFASSVGQRSRWAKGVTEVQGEYTLRLLKKGKIPSVLNLWYEWLAVICCNIIPVASYLEIGLWQGTAAKCTAYLFFTANILVAVSALVKDKKFDKKVILNLFGFLIYILSWIPAGIKGFFSKEGWYHTKHGETDV